MQVYDNRPVQAQVLPVALDLQAVEGTVEIAEDGDGDSQ